MKVLDCRNKEITVKAFGPITYEDLSHGVIWDAVKFLQGYDNFIYSARIFVASTDDRKYNLKIDVRTDNCIHTLEVRDFTQDSSPIYLVCDFSKKSASFLAEAEFKSLYSVVDNHVFVFNKVQSWDTSFTGELHDVSSKTDSSAPCVKCALKTSSISLM